MRAHRRGRGGHPPGRESLDVTFGERLEPALLARARFGGEFLPQFARVPGRSGVEKLLHVRGKNLRDILGLGTFDADAIARAARAVVLANADLLRLEPGSGTLVFDGVRFADTSAHAAWRQVATLADGSRVPVEGSVLSVNFDARGNVAYVLRCVWDGVDGLAPAALGVEEARARVLAELTSVPLVIRREGGTGREQLPFAPRTAELEGPMVHVGESGRPVLAYFATVSGEILGLPESPKKGSYAAYVDALDGALLGVFPTAVGFQDYSAKGTVRVHQNEPMYPDTIVAPVYHLDSSVFELEGRDLTVHDELQGDPVNSNRVFDFFGLPYPSNIDRAVAEAYFAGDSFISYYRKLGFDSLFGGAPIYVDALDIDFFFTAYSFAQQQVWLNTGAVILHADDPMVMDHEIGHYMHHLIGIGLNNPAPYQYPFHQSPPDEANAAMDEGSTDFRSCSFFNTPAFAPIYNYDQTGVPGQYLRLLDRDLTILENWSFDYYDNGEIWGSLLWKLRNILGKSVIERLSVEFVTSIQPSDGFNEGLECVVQADESLYGGIHEDAIRRVFAFAKVYGASGSYSFTTDWIRSPQRPYPNTEASEQVLTLTGAASLGGIRLVLSNDSDVNLNDALEVRDGNGTLVASLTKGQLANAVIVVPDSDEARLSIPSNPSDNLGGNGYNVVAAVTVNAPSAPPVFTLEVTPGLGMDPLPVTFRVTGTNLVAVTVATGDGSPDGHLEEINGAFEFAHVYNYDVNSGPIVEGRWFEPTITVTNDQGRQTTVTRRVWVNPYRPGAQPAAPGYGAVAGTASCTMLQNGTFHCP